MRDPLRLWPRSASFWLMLAHLLRHPGHIEVVHTQAILIGPFSIGYAFVSRMCATCGYHPLKGDR